MAIYDEIEEKDSTIYSCLNARKTAVLSYDRNVLPASDSAQDKKIAEFVEETLRDYFGSSENLDTADEGQFDSFLYESLDAIGRGMSIGEIIYAEASDRIYVKEVKFKPQHLFAFGDTNLAAYLDGFNDVSANGQIVFAAGRFGDGIAARHGVARTEVFRFFLSSALRQSLGQSGFAEGLLAVVD